MATGYSRQSAADIVTGNGVRASHFNNEFNAIAGAMDSSTGHTHDGTAGGGAKIPPAGLVGVTANGVVIRTDANNFVTRSVTGTANEIAVANGDGVLGAPTLSLPSALTFTGKTVTGGTFESVTLNSSLINGTVNSSAATLTGGTLDNMVIGGTTAAAGTFTTLSATGTITGGSGSNVLEAISGVTTLRNGNGTGVSATIVSGGNSGSVGGNIVYYGQGHALYPNRVAIRSGTTVLGYSDATGVLTWNGAITASGQVNIGPGYDSGSATASGVFINNTVGQVFTQQTAATGANNSAFRALQGTSSVFTVQYNGNITHSGNLSTAGNGTFSGTVSVDTVNENTAAAGVTIDGVLCKDGQVSVGTWSGTGATAGWLALAGGTGGVTYSSTTLTTSTLHNRFYNPNGLVGSISTNGTSTSFTTSSDEWWKNFIGEYDPMKAIDIIRRDPVRDFHWRGSGEYAVGWGAQTSYAVSADLATPGGWFDDESGEPAEEGADGAVYIPWGVDQGKRTPYLWAAVTWLLDERDAMRAELDDLKARLSALEAAS